LTNLSRHTACYDLVIYVAYGLLSHVCFRFVEFLLFFVVVYISEMSQALNIQVQVHGYQVLVRVLTMSSSMSTSTNSSKIYGCKYKYVALSTSTGTPKCKFGTLKFTNKWLALSYRPNLTNAS